MLFRSAAIIRNNALRKLLPASEFGLVNVRYGYFLGSKNGISAKDTVEQARQGLANSAAIYSELLPLKINDPQAQWQLSANASDLSFYTSADYRSIASFRLASVIAILVLCGLSVGGIWVFSRQAATKALAQQDRKDVETQRQNAAKQQEHVVRALSAAMAAIAKGDLSMRLTQTFSGAYEDLRSDFNAAVTQMSTASERARHDAAAEQAGLVSALGLALSSIAQGDLTARINARFPEAYSQLKEIGRAHV